MIIGRKQVILAALVLALGAAIFLNWKFSGANGVNLAGVVKTSSTLGATSYVDNQKVATASSTSNYFAEARLTREQTRDSAEDALKAVTTSVSATAAQKQAATTEIEAIANNITNEGNIESLIKAKGFSDCVAFINNGKVSVVVMPKTGNTLTASDVAQIDGIVIEQTKVSVDNINIIQAK
jgi:stage III sporulation protein AH